MGTTLKDRVGRYARAQGGHKPGDPCRNFKADQQMVIDLLNMLPVGSGGKGGTLRPPIVDGTCDEKLYQAILDFEKRWFPKDPPNGFVDETGPVFKKLFEEAKRIARAAPDEPAAKAPRGKRLGPGTLLRTQSQSLADVYDPSTSSKTWSTADNNKAQELIDDALVYLDRLINEEGRITLPFEAVLFGRAYVLQPHEVTAYQSVGAGIVAVDKGGVKHRVSDSMHKGTPLTYRSSFATPNSPALVLFQDGISDFVPSDYVYAVATEHETDRRQSVGKVKLYHTKPRR
jgi:hypothetical protein